MAQASSREDNTKNLRLEKALLYLIGKESASRQGEAFKIPIANVHKVVKTIEEDLEDLGIRLKFHDSVGHTHSQQVEEALDKLIPYLIPVSNPSYSLDVYDHVGENALDRADEYLSAQHIDELDQIFHKDAFRESLKENSRVYEG